MMLTRSVILITALLIPTPAGAHRLDEYLQAVRVGIERDRVNVDIDLTPGVSIARQVTGWIDSDGNGEISSLESATYAREVLRSIAVSVDHQTVALSLVNTEAPTVQEISGGIGTLRVRASGSMSPSRTGRHELTLTNTHRPETSVYLANALVPSDRTIHIADQRRAQDQHNLTIDYEVGLPPFWTRSAWLLSAFATLGGTAWSRRRLGHFLHRQTHPI